ncbi:MAG: phytanoyl-CoA dioxygenase family protein [Phycisphaerales bacterium]|nr:phytanoyl-CoA dioxygenase family protein [Phycisphaerales bacterium]
MDPAALHTFQRDGVLVLQSLITPEAAHHYAQIADPLLGPPDRRRPGARRVLEREPRLTALANDPAVKSVITSLAGPRARVVRSILFNKNPDTNWLVPWHQDPTIAVAERIDAPGFGPWNTKDGEPHCQPPLDILESIVVIRIHLDPCPADAGPLRVLRATHRRGLLTEAQIAAFATTHETVEATTPAGGAAIISPLSVHNSPKATMPKGNRRVLHLECTALNLPDGLRWAEAS